VQLVELVYTEWIDPPGALAWKESAKVDSPGERVGERGEDLER
jgi:hypothetical protein